MGHDHIGIPLLEMICRKLFPKYGLVQVVQYLWPARSPEMRPLDFFLWIFVKDRIYVEYVHIIHELKRRITEVIEEGTGEMFRNVW